MSENLKGWTKWWGGTWKEELSGEGEPERKNWVVRGNLKGITEWWGGTWKEELS